VLLAACGNPSGHADANGDAIDAPGAPQVSGQLIELVEDNDASLQPETHIVSLLPPRVTMSARLDDGSTVQPTVVEGLFAFPLAHAGQRYQLAVSIDGDRPTIFDSTSPTLVVGTGSIGRVDRVPITKPTTVSVTIGNFSFATGDFVLFDSTGVWMQQGMSSSSTSNPATFTVDLSNPNGWFDGKPSLFSAAEHDQAMFVEWRVTPPTLATVVASLPLSITTVDGSAQSVSGNVSSNNTVCLGVTAPRDQDMNRLLTALPDGYTTFTDLFFIESPMGPGFGPGGSRELVSDVQTSSTSLATTFNAPVNFQNAFGASHVLIEMAIGLARPIGGTLASIGTSTFIDVPLGAGCPAASVPAAMSAIPANATVAGTKLDVDTTLHLDATAPVPVTWDVAAPGPVEEYVVQLVEVTNPLKVIAQVVTTGTDTTLDRSLLVDGHTYAIVVIAQTGLPNIAAGDFVTTSFPFARANSFSHPFTVQP
jgi:hypothetical protein